MSENTATPRPRPVHIQVCAVMSDGTTLSWELPITACDAGEIAFARRDVLSDGPFPQGAQSGVDVELAVRVGYRGDLNRAGGLYRADVFGGAALRRRSPAGSGPTARHAVM